MSRSDVLVDADWVESKIGEPGVVIVEVDEDTSAYDKGHIPSAIKIDWKKDLQDPVRRDFVDKAGFEALLSERGISQRRHRGALRREQQLVRRVRILVLQAVRSRQRAAARRRPQEVGARLARADQGRAEPYRDELHRLRAGLRDPCAARRGRVVHRRQEPCRRPLAGRVHRAAARPGPPAAGAGATRRARADRPQHPVVEGGERGRYLPGRRRARRSCTARRAWTSARTPSPTAGSASARRTPGSSCTRSSGRRTSRTTTVLGLSTARWLACRSSWERHVEQRPERLRRQPAGSP